jgi:hypothetical protein
VSSLPLATARLSFGKWQPRGSVAVGVALHLEGMSSRIRIGTNEAQASDAPLCRGGRWLTAAYRPRRRRFDSAETIFR